jgi:cell division protein FtsW
VNARSAALAARRSLASWLPGRGASGDDGPAAALPVRDRLELRSSGVTRITGFDQAFVAVALALLALGVVMVYSASVALPDNPKFARYAATHFLSRHCCPSASPR